MVADALALLGFWCSGPLYAVVSCWIRWDVAHLLGGGGTCRTSMLVSPARAGEVVTGGFAGYIISN